MDHVDDWHLTHRQIVEKWAERFDAARELAKICEKLDPLDQLVDNFSKLDNAEPKRMADMTLAGYQRGIANMSKTRF